MEEVTKREISMLETAKYIIAKNSEYAAALSGSLLLKYVGMDLRRAVHDLDIIVTHLPGYFDVPVGFLKVPPDKVKSVYPDVVQYEGPGFKIDFIRSQESRKVLYGVVCGDIQKTIHAKRTFACISIDAESQEKHKLDVGYLESHNDLETYENF